MQSNINYINAYLKKQNAFTSLVKNIQYSLQSKEYKQFDCSLDEFVKMRWNISKAQVYRYLISAKVIDQLQEFEIQPCYERICRALYNAAKTPKQMKLLWGSIVKSAGNRPDSINSSHIKKMWKKLSDDKKYAKICHFEDEIMNRVEMSLNKSSDDIKTETETGTESETETKNKNEICTSSINRTNTLINTPQYSFYPSPLLNDTVSIPTTIQNNSSEYQSQSLYYPSPIQNSSISSLASSVNSSYSSLYNEVCNDQLNSNSIPMTISSNPSINFTKYPMTEFQYSSQPINPQSTKFFSNYQMQPQQQVLYYY